jgi:hypothetical protein
LIPGTRASGAMPAGISPVAIAPRKPCSAVVRVLIAATLISTGRGISETVTLLVGPVALPAARRQPGYRLRLASRRTEAVVVWGQAVSFRGQSLTRFLLSKRHLRRHCNSNPNGSYLPDQGARWTIRRCFVTELSSARAGLLLHDAESASILPGEPERPTLPVRMTHGGTEPRSPHHSQL